MNKHSVFFRYSCLAAILASSFPTWAQVAGHSHIKTLDTVVVTGVAPESPLTFVTDPKKPRQPLPASDATDYLKTIPGFSAVRNGGSNGDPVLRGMFGSRLAILTNGTTMLGACPSRMDSPSSYISPETYDRLTVVKGPQSVLWGPGVSAGLIKFDRDAPGFTEPGILFDGNVTGGSWGRNDQNADVAVGNDKIYTRITANRSHSQDYEDGDGNIVPSRWDKWNTDVAIGLTPDADTLIELSAGMGDGEARYAGRGMDGSQFKRESLGLRFEKDNMGRLFKKIEAQVYYNRADHIMDNYSLRPAPKMRMASNVVRDTWGGRLAGTLELSDTLSLVTGMDHQANQHSKPLKGGFPIPPRFKDAEFSNTGLFGELTWRASQADRVIGGARIDRAGAKDFRTAATSPTGGTQRDDTLPSGFLRYERDLQSVPATVYAGIGHVQRFPDYWELFSPARGPVGYANAFQGVKPEKTTQLDFGAQYKTDNLDAWFAGYAGYVKDYILFDYGTGSSQARNINARILGGELGASYNVAANWTVGGSLAYAWGENRGDSSAMPQIPPLEARLNAGYASGNWTAGALWRLVAAQNRYTLNQGNVTSKDFGSTAGFGVLSLNGGYAVNKRVQLTFGVDNVLNKTYNEHLNLAGNGAFGYSANTAINEPGRTVWARVSMKY